TRLAGQSGRLLQRKCSCGTPLASSSGECDECKKSRLQTKLAIGAANDPLERQADDIAGRVMSASEADRPLASGRQISRTSSEGAASGEAARVSPRVDRVLGGTGQALDAPTRGFMEARFGYDFGHVRVHADAEAAESARDMSALAYTVGSDI